MCHEFVAALAQQSAAIAATALHNRMTDATLGGHAFNLANCAARRPLQRESLTKRRTGDLAYSGFAAWSRLDVLKWQRRSV
jgi:hypothetical protein